MAKTKRQKTNLLTKKHLRQLVAPIWIGEAVATSHFEDSFCRVGRANGRFQKQEFDELTVVHLSDLTLTFWVGRSKKFRISLDVRPIICQPSLPGEILNIAWPCNGSCSLRGQINLQLESQVYAWFSIALVVQINSIHRPENWCWFGPNWERHSIIDSQTTETSSVPLQTTETN